ncbi:MAG: DUF3553 domain-containing protein [Shimia sp.]
MENLNAMLEPGQRVRHPDRPDWGIGQVQSNVGGRVTVNFPEAGKVVVDGRHVTLIPVYA